MVGVMRAIYAMVDGNVSGAVRGGTEEKASKHAEKLFVLIDTDGDGNLTEKEFLRVGKKGQSLSFQNKSPFVPFLAGAWPDSIKYFNLM